MSPRRGMRGGGFRLSKRRVEKYLLGKIRKILPICVLFLCGYGILIKNR